MVELVQDRPIGERIIVSRDFNDRVGKKGD